MNWKEYYERRQISPEQAAALVKPGMRVAFPLASGPVMQNALAAYADKIGGTIDLRLSSPQTDPGWFSRDMSSIFRMEFESFIGNVGRAAHDRHLGTFLPNLISVSFKTHDERPQEDKPVDITFIETSPPNEKGYVNFGPFRWNRPEYARKAKCVVALTDATMLRSFGDVYMHVSEFDYFVEATPPPPDSSIIESALARMDEAKRNGIREIMKQVGIERIWQIRPYLERTPLDELVRFFGLAEEPERYKAIAGYLSELIEDGATIQIGIGEPSAVMPKLGAFSGKHDLGLHTEMVAPGIARLVDAGVINGRRKTIHHGKAIAVAWSGSAPEDLMIIDKNPAFELYSPAYVLQLSTVSSNYKQTSINNALSVDLTGQINSETVFGARMMNGPGGQPETHLGAFLSPGGRAITLLPSTAHHDAISRIVPQLESGSLVTIPRFFADTVVTEYGIARLLGKNHRERAFELIAVAHPDHRAQLSKAARELFG
jgi:4-hydroxybutyrate CoA-transferase